MLREITDESKPDARWFTDEEIDLYVWFEQETIIAFQICYDKTKAEHALTWKLTDGFSHTLVDTDEDSPGRNMSPVLLDTTPKNVAPLLEALESRTCQIPEEIASFIFAKLQS